MQGMNRIDEIFRSGEHQKEMELTPQLFQRMNQELEESKKVVSLKKVVFSIAASIIAILSIGVLNRSDQGYQLEELIQNSHPIINAATIDAMPSNYPAMVYQEGFLKG